MLTIKPKFEKAILTFYVEEKICHNYTINHVAMSSKMGIFE